MLNAVLEHKIPTVLTAPPVAFKIKIGPLGVVAVSEGIFDGHNFGVALLAANFLAKVPALAGLIALLNSGAAGYENAGITAPTNYLTIFDNYGAGRLFDTRSSF